MRKRFYFMAIWVLICVPSFSQNSGKGFSEFGINYNLSFISSDPFTTYLGLNLYSTYTINKNFSINAGITFKPTRKEVNDYDFIGDWVITGGHAHQELTAFFLDFPIHVDYKIFNINTFSFMASSGPRLFYLNTSHEFSMTSNNQDPIYYKEKRSNINLGIDLGLVQKISITDRLGLFASEHYGQALLGFSKGFESTDLDFGITYKFK